MISVDAYPFLAFSDLTCHLEDTEIGASGCTVPPDVRILNLEVATKLLLHQQVKILSGVDISEVPGCHLLQQMSFQKGSQKLLQGLVSHELTAYLSSFNLF